MALTSEDVMKARFRQTRFREGYSQDDVDEFLDEVAVEIQRLNGIITALQEGKPAPSDHHG
ncbi:DivIVA domain-containing protein [Arthrobacter antioxidans]|uniref:DivIVA domain-containing protein n=1 Tax=Arthrobacter antioxidans TaxID=2895818 RepID=UPI0022A972A9|nr:DivIVA domain-containing protein [Arthrobacter antioxidans]